MSGKDKVPSNRDLGMDRDIDRRDFLNGVAVSTVALAAAATDAQAAEAAAAQDRPGYYPPERTGMRGSHPGSFEVAHELRDGKFWQTAAKPEDVDTVYDLIVVGGGISGLSAAYFYRAAKPDAKILILDNHDDFGGHAKRNEFQFAGGRMELMNGGTMLIDSPRPYSAVADGLMKSLGIDPVALAKQCNKPDVYRSLGLQSATFFDRETFGTDKLVVDGGGRRRGGESRSLKLFLDQAPLTDKVKADILRIEEGNDDYLPALSSAEKKDRLSGLSYRDFLLTIAKVDPGVIPFYQTRTHGEWGIGIDAEPALDCWGLGLPGFQGMKLDPGSAPRMGYTAAGYADGGSYRFHFPDGNATIARLLVRNLIPAAMPGASVEDVVTARANYAALDRKGAPVRVRLSSIVVGARNIGDPANSRGVEVAYARDGHVFRVHGVHCVLASWNMMIPYICPELPAAQKAALHQLVKVPLVYTTVALDNWRAFQKLGIQGASCPGGYFTGIQLNATVDIGSYRSVRSPDEPILVHLTRTPCKPGLPERDQHRAGRYELLATPFETFERNIRDLMGRVLGAGGFDPAKDIRGIMVNRWPHGYAYEYNPLFDDFDVPPDQLPHMVGRKHFGRIHIANSDSGAGAYTSTAIDQGRRAVDEIVAG
ncbi:MAG: NAD(P)-binding protein [Alphaproteobacteria bacterium]|nr:NAD(P)-binding protein [Alphaproteobacteria bacterium]